MQQNFDCMLLRLGVACRHLDPADDTYEKLRWEERELILFLERALADSLLLDTRDVALQSSEIYGLLGLLARPKAGLIPKKTSSR